MPHAPLARDATIADVLATLAKRERYLRGVLQNLYTCQKQQRVQKGDVVARIGITGRGTFPHYRIDYYDDVDLSAIGLGRRTMPATFGAFDGRTHKVIAAFAEASVQREESILKDEHWSTRSMSLEEVANLLGQIRGFIKVGGNLAEAMKIGRLVRALKLQTIVPSRSSPRYQDEAVAKHHLKNPKANYMCASACFFVFAAGINRASDYSQDAILGIHRPYLSDNDLRTLSGDQAITSANRVRAAVEKYLKEMSVPAKYADLMFSVSKDEVRWLNNADFDADLQGTIPELKDWLAARCDKRTDVEKAVWESLRTNIPHK